MVISKNQINKFYTINGFVNNPESVLIWSSDKKFKNSLLNIIDTNSKDCKLITTTTGQIELPINEKILTIKYGDFDSTIGYIKTIEYKLVSDLKVGDILLSQYTKPELVDQKEKFIDIYPIISEYVSNNFFGYKVELEEEDVIIYSTNKKSLIPYKRYQPAKSLLNIMAWYITEGSTSTQWKKDPKASKFLSSFTQSTYRNLESAESICEDIKSLGIKISVTRKNKKINGLDTEVTYQFNSCMSVLMQTCGCNSKEKHIPKWIMKFLTNNPEYINEFLCTMIEGDGYISTITGLMGYCSVSWRLIEDVSFLCKLIGLYVKIELRPHTNTHYISIGQACRKVGLIRFDNFTMTKITKIEDVGKLPCQEIVLSMPGNIFVGSLGNILI